MSALLVPDYMGDLRAWARTQPDLAALLAGRVFFRIPNQPRYPLIRLLDISTAPVPGEAPTLSSRQALYVWGGQPSDYAAVNQVTLTLLSLLNDNVTPWLAGQATVIQSASASARDNPDPETGAPRKVVDAVLVLRAKGPADQL